MAEKCQLNIQVQQKDGSPAPFARIAIFRVVRFLWWDIWWHVITVMADFYGKATVTLEKNVRYQVRARWIGADGRWREKTEPIILTVCPWTMRIQFPW